MKHIFIVDSVLNDLKLTESRNAGVSFVNTCYQYEKTEKRAINF
jgi:hypothetical protein